MPQLIRGLSLLRILSSVFGRPPASVAARRPARLPDGLRVYAIGDLHGRADLLDAMLARIAEHSATAPAVARQRVVLLGDIVDRGPDSRGAVERLLAPALPDGFEIETLMGNHERMMLDFLDDPTVGRPWLNNGGLATLTSYGVTPPLGSATPERLAPVRAELGERLPAEHRRFLEERPLWLEIGDYVFVHAGIRPGRPMSEQSPADLLWIRAPFLDSAEAFLDRVVVHGHSVTQEPELRPGRIGIDTGACHTGVLTCAVLEGSGRGLLQTAPDSLRRSARRSR